MTVLYSFPPVAAPDARVLILGSMPGAASLAAGQYYAHPRNLFWAVMGELVGARMTLAYADRIQKLKDAKMALWDVLQSCEREGSLDTNIQNETPHDFAKFFAAHPRITQVFFNGRKAEASFRQHFPGIMHAGVLQFHTLPSTSPAHAGRSFAEKLAAWRAIQAV